MDMVRAGRSASGFLVLRLALAAFVLAWLFTPLGLRGAVPIWLPFLIALGLELHFFLGGRGSRQPAHRADRLPQTVDRERFGYGGDADELLLVRDQERDLWIPYSRAERDDLDALIADAVEDADAEEDDDAEADNVEEVDVAEGDYADEEPPLRRRRPVGQLAAGLAVIAVLAAVVWIAGGRGWAGLDAETRAEAGRLFSSEAARIAGRPVTIRCDEAGDYVGAVQHADGVAVVGGSLAYLTPERCYDLYRLAFRDEVTSGRTARALAVLAHEAWHLHGIRDEGVTECYALQSAVEIGVRLGLSEPTARQMMRQQLAENALRARRSPEYLVPPECRAGGELDLDPSSSRFP
jgi:hypothetical protein